MQALSKHSTSGFSESRILIVDADLYLCSTLRQQLNAEGFKNVFDIGEISEIDNVMKSVKPDLILLDFQLPNCNIADICRSFRKTGFVKPIVLLIEKGLEFDISDGVDIGVSDFLLKPLRISGVLECIYSQLRLFKSSQDLGFNLGELTFIPLNKKLLSIDCGQEQLLTEKEATILNLLYQVYPESVSKDDILAEVWGLKSFLTTHTLETHIYRLRQKISRLTQNQVVVTTENGYRINKIFLQK